MAQTKTHGLPVPRAMSVVFRRARGVERITAYDVLPVAIRVATDAEAPVAVERTTRGAEAPAEVRVLDGRFYLPLGHGAEHGAVTAENLGAAILANMDDVVGEAFRYDRWPLADWKAIALGRARKRGMQEVSSLDIASVVEDGRAAQADLVSRWTSDLVDVDGRLHHLARAPRLELLGIPHSAPRFLVRFPHHGLGPTERDRFALDEFRLDRPEEALAYAGAWLERYAPGAERTPPDVASYRLVRPDLYAAAMPPADLATATADHLDHLAREAAGAMGYLDDDALADFVAVRGLARSGLDGPDAATEAMGRVRRLAVALAAAEARPHLRRHPGHHAEALATVRNAIQVVEDVILRHDAIDLPRRGTDVEDASALAGLAP